MTIFNICRLLKCEVQLKTFHNEKALVKHCQTSLSCLPGRRRRCGPWPRRTRCTCRGAGRRSRRSCEHCCEILANIVLWFTWWWRMRGTESMTGLSRCVMLGLRWLGTRSYSSRIWTRAVNNESAKLYNHGEGPY